MQILLNKMLFPVALWDGIMSLSIHTFIRALWFLTIAYSTFGADIESTLQNNEEEI